MGRSTPKDRKRVRHIYDQFIFSCFVRNIFLGMNFILYDLYLNFIISFVDQISSQINKKEQKYRVMKCVQYKPAPMLPRPKQHNVCNVLCISWLSVTTFSSKYMKL